ncbi:glutaminase A [Acetobacter orientalis]|uniref:Glutaminase A n=1 Tax=Acetobacter orientalis TaxID=146474 RepID=A0A2Z5ZL26_9PROT|nr:glutaminase A [Acetobacter orientalis]
MRFLEWLWNAQPRSGGGNCAGHLPAHTSQRPTALANAVVK